jgi:hypothetical protein
MSGYGREQGAEALENYTEHETVWANHCARLIWVGCSPIAFLFSRGLGQKTGPLKGNASWRHP